MSTVRTEIRDQIAIVTLDDPERRNAISLPLVEGIVEAFDALEAYGNVGAVVVTGAPPAFCAGADLGVLEGATRDSLQRIYNGFLRVARSSLPTVAAVNGPAVGAGFNLALVCDLRVAARSARFDCRFLDLGLHPGGGHTWMLRRSLGLQGAMAMVLFGEALDGEAACRRGLVWSCVDDESLLDEACRLAGRAASFPPELVREFKATVRDMAGVHSHVEAVERELGPQHWSLHQSAFAERLATLRRRIRGSSD